MPTQETIPIRWIKEKDEEGVKQKIFPRTHIRAVKDDNGTSLEELLQEGHMVIDGGSARTVSLNLAARRINCGTAADKV